MIPDKNAGNGAVLVLHLPIKFGKGLFILVNRLHKERYSLMICLNWSSERHKR